LHPDKKGIFSSLNRKFKTGTGIRNVNLDDDRPFIVLTETKPSNRHIPVSRYSPLCIAQCSPHKLVFCKYEIDHLVDY